MRWLDGVGEFLEACHVAGELAGGVVGAELVGGRGEEVGAPERCGAHHGEYWSAALRAKGPCSANGVVLFFSSRT